MIFELFLMFFLVHWGVLVILYKYDLKSMIALFAKKKQIKLFYEISECEFCLDHHVGVFLVLPLLCFDFSWSYFLYPLMSSALCNIVKTLSKC